MRSIELYIFHVCLVLQITSRWFNVFRSACTLNHLTDHRRASKMDPLVTVHCVAINTHRQRFVFDTTHIYDESQASSTTPLFRGRPLHHVDTSRTSISREKLSKDRTCTADILTSTHIHNCNLTCNHYFLL
jgi:hypothetical protein